MQEFLNLNSEVLKAKNKVEEKTKEIFKKITDTAEYNQIKVLNAFREYKVSQQHFIATSGYGYLHCLIEWIVCRCGERYFLRCAAHKGLCLVLEIHHTCQSAVGGGHGEVLSKVGPSHAVVVLTATRTERAHR